MFNNINCSDRQRVGVIIHTLRMNAKLKQDYVARVVGISQASLSKVESGLRDLPLSKIPQLSIALKISPLELFCKICEPNIFFNEKHDQNTKYNKNSYSFGEGGGGLLNC